MPSISPIATARERVEAITKAMDPTEATAAVRAALPIAAAWAAASEHGAHWPDIGHEPADRIALAALGAGVNIGASGWGFFSRQVQTLLETIADDCDAQDASTCRLVAFASTQIQSGHPINLNGMPAYFIRRLLDAKPQMIDGTCHIATTARLLTILVAAEHHEFAVELLDTINGPDGLDKAGVRKLLHTIDQPTRNWIISLLTDPDTMIDLPPAQAA